MSDQNPQQNNPQNPQQNQNVPPQKVQGSQQQGSSQDTDLGERIREIGAEIWRQGRKLWKRGNQRELIMRTRDNDLILQMPLTLAVVFGIIFLFRALPLLIAAIVAALIFRVQIILHKTDGGSSTPPN